MISKFLFFLLLPIFAQAGARIVLLSNFVQDNKSIASSDSSSNLIDVSLNTTFLPRNSNWVITIGYLSSTSKEPLDANTEATLTTQNPYAGLTWYIGRKGLFSLGAYYSPIVQAKYTRTGTVTETWMGTSYMGRLSINPVLYKELRAQLSVTYTASQYTEKGASATVSSVQTFEKSTISPLIGLSFQF